MVEKTSIDEQQEDNESIGLECYIIKGLPGSGKSTLASIISREATLDKKTSKICCADDFFISANGKYNWYASGIADAHSMCRTKFSEAISNKVHTIIVVNTNTRHSEYNYYYKEAKKTGYFVQVITVGEFSDEAIERYAVQNTHGVTKDILIKMRDRFQH